MSADHADVVELSDDINLSRGEMVFFALCSGGDYSPGIKACGPTIAHVLAKVGFSDRLFATMENLDRPAFFAFLRSWRDELVSFLHQDRHQPWEYNMRR